MPGRAPTLVNWYSRGWDMKDADQTFEQELDLSSGIAAFEAKHFVKAQQLLAGLADNGHPEAQFRMAVMYQNGLGMVANPERAARYMRQAAEQGHALAQHGLGFMYMEGECVEADGEQAVFWLEKAAAQGLQGSLATLGMMFNEGRGVEQDRERAAQYYRRAGFDPAEFG